MALKADLDDETLGGEAEAPLVAELRAELAADLAAVKAAGHDFPHTTGDIFMLRVLRGSDRDVKQAAQWYRRFLAVRQENDLDGIFKKHGDLPWTVEAMPNGKEMQKIWNMHFDENRMRSSEGHLLWYDSVADCNAEELLKQVDTLTHYIRCVCEVRLATLDRLSRQQGRLVKIIKITDNEGFAPWSVDRELMQWFKGFAFPLVQSTSAESSHRVFLINTAWFAMKVFGIFKPLMPERAQRRTIPLGRDFMENPEFAKSIPGALIMELVATRRADGDDANLLEGTKRLIAAGRTMDRSIQVKKGTRVAWEFTVGSPSEADGGSARGFAGRLLDKGLGEVTDVKFEVALWSDAKGASGVDEDGMMQQHVLVPMRKVHTEDGQVCDSIEAPVDGTLVLRWCNSTGWIRAKLVSSYKITVT